ncbi:motile sperm domain-containing protein 1-like [Anneissia japonica]|uniref:motile sperm domain-containing protein 1-like n=1 Tax=Anneissia japonica TaxID=1529436 RepID=UPI00142552DD|nr:motile sperm domain-containing protein 1-like [Anneissia japonica]
MQLGQRPRLVNGKLPVFAFPSELNYYADDRSSHKQVLTLYNPYEFPLRFKVLSTSPKKYTVIESEGTIKHGCCIDVVIRYKDVNPTYYGSRDKFRLQIYEQGQRKSLGRKDIVSMLFESSQEKGKDSEFEESESSVDVGGVPSSSQHLRDGTRYQSSGPSLLMILLTMACMVALMVPTQGDKESRLPEYLHLTINQKLIAAYILGLVTMVLLRT